jgi:hypothetical protein
MTYVRIYDIHDEFLWQASLPRYIFIWMWFAAIFARNDWENYQLQRSCLDERGILIFRSWSVYRGSIIHVHYRLIWQNMFG